MLNMHIILWKSPQHIYCPPDLFWGLFCYSLPPPSLCSSLLTNILGLYQVYFYLRAFACAFPSVCSALPPDSLTVLSLQKKKKKIGPDTLCKHSNCQSVPKTFPKVHEVNTLPLIILKHAYVFNILYCTHKTLQTYF